MTKCGGFYSHHRGSRRTGYKGQSFWRLLARASAAGTSGSNGGGRVVPRHEAAHTAFKDAQKEMDSILGKTETMTAAIKDKQIDLEKNKLEALKARKLEQECIKEQDALIPLEQTAREKFAELKSVLDSEKSQGSVLKAILQAKEFKQIEGIYGRMGDLGAIDAKYDVAISTACPGLDYIVVETTAAAQACVELLRREQLGIATFMILEEQVDLLERSKEKVKTPEGVSRLYDLIKVQDERMKLAFYASLGNTIVAKDLDQATRIAYGGNREFRRVVTLDGALFERSGTMSGGGSKPRGGKMGTSIQASSVSRETVIAAEEELANMVDSLKTIRQRIADAVRRYQASEKVVSELEMEIAKSQKEVDSFNSEYKYLEKQLDSLEAASRPKQDEIERLEELKKIISTEEKEIDRLIQGSKKLKEKDIDKNSTEINRHKVQIETGEKMVKKLTKGIEESKKEKERIIEGKDKMQGVFKEIEQKAFIVQENYKKVQKLIDEHEEVLEKSKLEHERVKKDVDQLRASEVDADFKLQDMKKMYKELEMKGKGYKKRLIELETSLQKHMEQIQKDLVDTERLQATLADETLTERDDIKKQYDEWRKKRLDEFMAGFNAISLKLKEMYQMITLGGDAELELVDSLDPFSEGVVFSVRPPKKSWKNIANLSGGEKTLSSLALVFALHHYKPTPLYVMDEIDAALDFKNVSIVGHYVKDRTKDAQFIIISLRNNMFELADRLVGIYKTDNCTKSITIDPNSFVVCEKAA
ncbi:Structural maintenance of chromosomes protein 4 [Hibiscus syriacus]|uniref:Structural maintenance of chromosomes protein 4 n=1 Tax=Hibiscus syriacus TaxID=106335 RepID=A0A6A2XTA4_HIBSY|nr:Structural maintenance of chromosomes protein 4 [Hibiscus syriacus]